MTRFGIWLSILSLCWAAPVTASQPARVPTLVEVFVAPGQAQHLEGKQGLQRRGIEIRIHDMGALTALEADLSRGLPADPAQAMAQARQRFQRAQADPAFQNRLHAAIGPLVRATELGIDRLPAVVINQEAIVYGEIHLPRALEHYQRWRHER
ncbi:TIGR03757 family integrating conjugative element protein [Ectothiorhodospira shaposhnikovii]|uniref:TIGR03757 family integrating conjugative element protein n=1 Tax=Ectothiorhodospira shaposhnikovii TaxID=1054 RepID=UPI0019077CF0|nr:TIGR03757 family integrating conjugative element protein [Ectothiorhodospira shaposhnikovii]MBK1674812.1 TIGR03757 family integrating conjugative element protein [Ectothiorhodospira shaposhnikovii]